MSIIKEVLKKIKELFDVSDSKSFLIVLVIILSSLASFGLGRLSKIEENHEPIIIENAGVSGAAALAMSREGLSAKETAPPVLREGGTYVASKNGSKYYFPWCSGAQKISEKNKVVFSSKEEAEKAGYQKASNCKGL